MFFIYCPPGVPVPVTGEFTFAHMLEQPLGTAGVQSEIVSAPATVAGTSISLNAPDASVQYQILSPLGAVLVDWTRNPGSVNPGQLVRMRGNVPNSQGGQVIGTLTVGASVARWILKARYTKPRVAYHYCDDPFTQQNWTDRVRFLKDLGYTRIIAQINWGGWRQYITSAYDIPKYGASNHDQCALFMNACGIVGGIEACIGKICNQLNYQASSTFRDNIYAQGRGAKSAVWFNNQWQLVAALNGSVYGVGGSDIPMMLQIGNPANNALLTGVCQEIATQFGPYEVVLDYIRHNGARMDTSLEQMARFNTFTGNNYTFSAAGNANQWPEVVLPSYRNARTGAQGAMYDTFKVWQAGQITALVTSISNALPASVKLGAAVFRGGAVNVGEAAGWYLMAQDWPTWLTNNKLQTAYPMTYTHLVSDFNNDLSNPDWIALRNAGKKIVPLLKNDHSGWVPPGTLDQWTVKADQIELALNTHNYTGVGIWQVFEGGSNLPSSAAITVCDNLVPNLSSYCRHGYVPPF